MKSEILFKRGYLESSKIQKNRKKIAFYIAKLLNEFGVVVDKPEMLSKQNIEYLSRSFGKDIPKGFYDNPQHLKYFSSEELIIEQFISYLQIELNGVMCLDESVFQRNEVFKKLLPSYMLGDEIKLRKYKIITSDEAEPILIEIAKMLCSYTRPWSSDEENEFKWLYSNSYYKGETILCKDNAIAMFIKYGDINFASMLDKKDIVKMSIYKFGEKKVLNFSDDDKKLFNLALTVAKDCPMSLKQAKYYNRILKNVNSKFELADNTESVHKKAINLIKEGNILEAAKAYATNGSLLERNLVFLLSRASLSEYESIINLLGKNNPIVLLQLLIGFINDNYTDKRVFSFTFNKLLKNHIETDKEFKFRKSVLPLESKNTIIKIISNKIKEYYKNKKSLGKIYINPIFKKVSLPINTSSMGMGIDVMPTGSRLPITFDYIRTFCYWNNVFDIDASVVFVDNNEKLSTYYWGNYSKKDFGDSCLCSGDCRDKDGAEYCDFKISELKVKGFKYAIYTLNGYVGDLNTGEIYCGLQNKKNLDSEVFTPKNIEFKINVKGDSRAYVGFAIDFDTNEIIWLNQVLANGNSVVNPRIFFSIKKYLNNCYIDNFNMYEMISYMGEVVDDINDADIVFGSSKDIAIDGKQVITPYDIEKLVNILK